MRVLEMIPEGSEVMTMTSVTNESIGLEKELNESGRYKPVRDRFAAGDMTPSDKRKLGAGPDFATGSVHALTESGQLVIASQSGSQLPAYAYGAGKMIWVVGAQKIVPDLDAAMERINNYVLGLESQRANKAYNITTGSSVNKLLIINKESKMGRAVVVIVDEALGF